MLTKATCETYVNKFLPFAPAFTEKGSRRSINSPAAFNEHYNGVNNLLNSLVRFVLVSLLFTNLRLAKKNSANVSQCRPRASSITQNMLSKTKTVLMTVSMQESGPRGKIPTKEEPIRTLALT